MQKSVLLRQQLLIDNEVQGSLLLRIGLYGLACLTYFLVILVLTESMVDPDEPMSAAIARCFDEAIYWAPGLMLLTPVMAYDLLRVTNRFAGPAFRLHREMRRLIDGESEYPLNFRDGDNWMEMADTFNEIRDELLQLRQEKESSLRARSSESEIVSQQKLFISDEDDQESTDDFLVGSAE